MSDLHGIILANHQAPELRELTSLRTPSSLPFAGRYRLIDFTLSSLKNAGVHDVGVVMRRDYQSLLDHLGSGKDWDMSRKRGGLRLLPPFGSLTGDREPGVLESLLGVRSYIVEGIKQDYVAICKGSVAANIDLAAAFRHHLSSGAEITVVGTHGCVPDVPFTKFILDENGAVKAAHLARTYTEGDCVSAGVYIMSKKSLLSQLDRFEDALESGMPEPGLNAFYLDTDVSCYIHPGYVGVISTLPGYYRANMDMLDPEKLSGLFPRERPVYTKGRSDVSTYYGESARAKNCLVADGCYIEGDIENCVIFRGVKIGARSVLRGCIIMQDTVIGRNATLCNIVSDKDVVISDGVTLAGSPVLPLALPKKSRL